MQQKYSDARSAAKKVQNINLSKQSLQKLSQSLRLAIEGLQLPSALNTEWGDYYTDTNYTEVAAKAKHSFLENIAKQYASRDSMALDMGANEGVYSRFLAKHFGHVLAADIDYLAIEKMYASLKQENNSLVTPLVVDLGNPPPGIGFAHAERLPFAKRCQVKYLSALALIHHLVFTAGIPFFMVADYFASLLKKDGICILEFVPMDDSQVQRLLAARKDSINFDYDIKTCQDAFANQFKLIEEHPIPESLRTILVFQKI